MAEMTIDGKKLRYWRHERFLNINELAEKTGVNSYTISSIERDAYPAVGSRPATVRKLAEGLGIDPHKLLVGASETEEGAAGPKA
jgi:transcriptional regulator with XRE-family HTH domain